MILGRKKKPTVFDGNIPDVLVVGAGIVCLASAYHIKRQEPSVKVLVIEKAPAPGQGDTAKRLQLTNESISR